MENEASISSKDSKNLTESKISEEKINDSTAQEIINNEFEILEDWVDEQFNSIKKMCINKYNNFNVNFPINNKKSKEKIIDSTYEEESL